jgi:hypothetical protein
MLENAGVSENLAADILSHENRASPMVCAAEWASLEPGRGRKGELSRCPH